MSSPLLRDIACVLGTRSWSTSREPVPGHSGTGAQADRGRPRSVGETATGQETRGSSTEGGLQTSQRPGRATVDNPPAMKHKFHSLIDKVYDWKNLVRAWRKVRANKGAHGLDRVTIHMFESDWETHLREIQRKLVQHRYEPKPVRRVYIPKASDSNRIRQLTRRQQGRNVEAVIRDLNAVIRGWARYVGVAQVTGLFRTLDRWIRVRVRAFRFKRKCTNDNRRLPIRRLERWGLLSLAQCRPTLRLQYTGASALRAGEAP